jgi:hypothetical protein
LELFYKLKINKINPSYKTKLKDIYDHLGGDQDGILIDDVYDYIHKNVEYDSSSKKPEPEDHSKVFQEKLKYFIGEYVQKKYILKITENENNIKIESDKIKNELFKITHEESKILEQLISITE